MNHKDTAFYRENKSENMIKVCFQTKKDVTYKTHKALRATYGHAGAGRRRYQTSASLRSIQHNKIKSKM